MLLKLICFFLYLLLLLLLLFLLLRFIQAHLSRGRLIGSYNYKLQGSRQISSIVTCSLFLSSSTSSINGCGNRNANTRIVCFVCLFIMGVATSNKQQATKYKMKTLFQPTVVDCSPVSDQQKLCRLSSEEQKSSRKAERRRGGDEEMRREELYLANSAKRVSQVDGRKQMSALLW